MEADNTLDFGSLIAQLIKTLFKRLGHLANLINLEAQLAGKTFLKIILLSFFVGLLLTASWLFLLATLAILLVSTLHVSWIFSLLIIAAVNFFLLAIICMIIMSAKENLLFHATRRQLNIAEGAANNE